MSKPERDLPQAGEVAPSVPMFTFRHGVGDWVDKTREAIEAHDQEVQRYTGFETTVPTDAEVYDACKNPIFKSLLARNAFEYGLGVSELELSDEGLPMPTEATKFVEVKAVDENGQGLDMIMALLQPEEPKVGDDTELHYPSSKPFIMVWTRVNGNETPAKEDLSSFLPMIAVRFEEFVDKQNPLIPEGINRTKPIQGIFKPKAPKGPVTLVTEWVESTRGEIAEVVDLGVRALMTQEQAKFDELKKRQEEVAEPVGATALEGAGSDTKSQADEAVVAEAQSPQAVDEAEQKNPPEAVEES